MGSIQSESDIQSVLSHSPKLNGKRRLSDGGSSSKRVKLDGGVEPNITDVLIIGGGPAGLSAALTLARQRHTAIVFDSGEYRNESSKHMHMVLAHDGEDPRKYRAAAKANILERYSTISFENTSITSLKPIEEGEEGRGSLFNATASNGQSWLGRKIILATGVKDILPSLTGYAENWGTRIFHCFFCHGYESRDSPSAGILAIPPLSAVPPALHFARGAKRFAKNVTIYTHGNEELQASLVAELKGTKQIFTVDERKISKLEKGAGETDVVLHFEDGTTATESFLGHKTATAPKGDIHEQLELEMTPAGDPKIHPMFCQTNVRGVFVGGDGAGPVKIVSQAVFSGSQAAASVCAQLQAEESGHKGMF